MTSHPFTPRRTRSALLPMGLATLLSACGGGGGDGGSATVPAPVDTSIPAQASTVFVATQAGAEALARDAEQRTRDMRLASGLAGSVVAGAGPSGGAAAAASADPVRKPLAVRDYTADLCSAGSASLDIPDAVLRRFETDPKATLQAGDSIAVTTRACTVKAALDLGDVGVGNFGVGSRIDGGFVLLLKSRGVGNASSDYLFSLTYTGFTYTPAGGSAYDPLNAVLQFGSSGGQQVFALDLADTRFLDSPQVASAGTSITVSSGSLRARAAAAAGGGWADYAYQGWTFDSNAQRASAGSVQVTGSAPNKATVSATRSGYRVDVTTAAGSASFNVAR